MTRLELRPLTLGEILDRTFTLYRRHFLLFIGIAAIPQVLVLAVNLIFLLSGAKTGRVTPASAAALGYAGLAFVLALITLVVAIIAYLFSQGGTIFAVSELYLGRSTSIAASLKRVWADIGSLFGVLVLNGLVIGVGILLLIVPGIYFACRLLVCVPSALIEGRGPSESLSRSWNLTRGCAGRAFVILLIFMAISVAIGALAGGPFGYIVATVKDPEVLRMWMIVAQIVNSIASVLVTPVLLIATSVFYFDLRVRKEAFDLQFMMDPHSERTTGSGSQSVPSILS
ncbi:MAG: glycerophosphoryl diester phosphodiesterase membrane domain-containing protein [Acidobacteriota bacterium]|nr:glycerophosphoryl diester phosphodiesterase membrane domain-containing protein [Acidobacteriota bacterium]